MVCCEAAEHEADHCEAHECSRLAGVPLAVAGEPTAAADPRERSFDDPALGEHDEPMPVTAAHDLEDPRAGPGDNRLHLSPLIACIGDHALQKGKAPARFSQQRLSPIPVLHMSRMHGDGQQQSKRVGQDVALTAQDLLARVIAGRVERGPPLRAPFAVWLSRIAVVGLASRPASSRTSTYNA